MSNTAALFDLCCHLKAMQQAVNPNLSHKPRAYKPAYKKQYYLSLAVSLSDNLPTVILSLLLMLFGLTFQLVFTLFSTAAYFDCWLVFVLPKHFW